MDEHKPGPELDAVMAEMMGWHRGALQSDNSYWFTKGPPKPGYNPGFPCPLFSTDIAAAWKVVEWLFKHNYAVSLMGSGRKWICQLNERVALANICFGALRNAPKSARAMADTAPLAICLAAMVVAEGTKAETDHG